MRMCVCVRASDDFIDNVFKTSVYPFYVRAFIKKVMHAPQFEPLQRAYVDLCERIDTCVCMCVWLRACARVCVYPSTL